MTNSIVCVLMFKWSKTTPKVIREHVLCGGFLKSYTKWT